MAVCGQLKKQHRIRIRRRGRRRRRRKIWRECQISISRERILHVGNGQTENGERVRRGRVGDVGEWWSTGGGEESSRCGSNGGGGSSGDNSITEWPASTTRETTKGESTPGGVPSQATTSSSRFSNSSARQPRPFATKIVEIQFFMVGLLICIIDFYGVEYVIRTHVL
jgi:hypothetical protein